MPRSMAAGPNVSRVPVGLSASEYRLTNWDRPSPALDAACSARRLVVRPRRPSVAASEGLLRATAGIPIFQFLTRGLPLPALGSYTTAMRHELAAIHIQRHEFWLARGAVAVAIVLQVPLFLVETGIPPILEWLAFSIEIILLVVLSITTRKNQIRAREAETDEHWHIVANSQRRIRALALILTAIITLVNLISLFELIESLAQRGDSMDLLLHALNIWGTNVIVFAVWFWELDRGGPATRWLANSPSPDFLFTQMTLGAPHRDTPFSPGFVDYLFLAFTNATAFSPADTLPLSKRAKILMMVEAMISLLTLALVAARAVNLLGESRPSPPHDLPARYSPGRFLLY